MIFKMTIEYFQGLLQQCMNRKGIRDNDPFDWEKSNQENSITTTTTTTNVATKETRVPG